MECVLVTGANRGIGLEFVRQYAEAGDSVIACSRNPDTADDLQALCEAQAGAVTVEQLDLLDFGSIDALAERLKDRPIDILINNAGAFGPRNDEATDLSERLERQLFGNVDYEAMVDTIKINAVAPLKLVEALHGNIKSGEGRKVVYISSSAGSIAGGLAWKAPAVPMIYTTSKCTTTKVAMQTSMVLKHDGIATVALCPGHVKTRLGGPEAFLEVEQSVSALRGLIGGLTMADNGTFRMFNGETVPW